MFNPLSPAPKSSQHQLSSNLFHKLTMGIILVTLTLIFVLVWYGLMIKQKAINIEKQWHQYNTETTVATYTLHRIQEKFGYGGFIHHFKNYVLRKDASLIPKIEQSLIQTRRAVNRYPLYGAFQDHDDEFYINELIKVIDQYSEHFELAKELIEKGVSSSEIDKKVRVNDAPAFFAIKHLSEHSALRNDKYAIETNKHLDNYLSFVTWGILLVPFILLSGLFMLRLLNKVIDFNSSLEENRKFLSDLFEASPDAILIVNESGVICGANLQAVELFDSPENNLMGIRVESLLPKRFHEQYSQLHIEYFTGSKAVALRHDLEFYALGKNNNETPVEISISYTYRDRQKYSLINFREITERKKAEKTLHRNEVMLRRAQRVTNIGSWDWDVEGNTMVWSDEIFNIFGLEKNNDIVNYDNFLALLHPDDKEEVVKAIKAALIYGKAYELEHRIIRPDGTIRLISEQGDVFRSDKGEAINMVGVVRDITTKKQNEVKLKLADNVFNTTMEAIVVTDSEGRILRVNSAFRSMTGYSNEEAMGKKPGELLSSGKHDKEFYDSMWEKINDKGSWHGEIWDKRKDGSLFLVSHTINAVKDNEGNVIQYLSIFIDITDKKNEEERIQYLAQYDQLTKLPNRSLFNDRLNHAIDLAQRKKDKIGLMFIDLDGFKKINDTHGHQAGDKLLQIISERLTNLLRAEDTVARIGGDEFTIILEKLQDTYDAIIIAEKIIQAVGKVITLSGKEVTVGASIGISIYPASGNSAENLIKNADSAMYIAKKRGKNGYNFYIE